MANVPEGVDPEEYLEELKIGAMTKDEKAAYEFQTLSGAVKEIFDQDAQVVHDAGVEKKKSGKKGGKKRADQVEVFEELDQAQVLKLQLERYKELSFEGQAKLGKSSVRVSTFIRVSTLVRD